MGNKLRRIFNPTSEENEEMYQRLLKWYSEIKKHRGCATCRHCKHVIVCPDFITCEECECTVGLKCDTVLFQVKNCPKWEECEMKRWWGKDNG